MRLIQLIATVRGRPCIWLIGALAAFGFIGGSPRGHARSPSVSPESVTESEGLTRIDVKGIDQVYARKDADLSVYHKVMLDPIEVSFQRGWDPHPAGTPVTAREKQEIRQGLADVLKDEFMAELRRSGRYPVVDAPGEDVLRVKVEIRDLTISAPDLMRPGIVRNYTVSTGELTLVAELRDAATGELIARVIDRRRDSDSPWFELTTRVTNEAAARRAAAHWARVLREQLDVAKAWPNPTNRDPAERFLIGAVEGISVTCAGALPGTP